MLTKNYTIITLYSTVFLLIGLLTAYFPLWLNQSLKLDTHYIGYILSISGILKVFFTITITLYIKNTNYLKNTLFLITVVSILVVNSIFYFGADLPYYITIFMVILFLILFSPVLPFIEVLFGNLVKKPLRNYGKIRISGSITFCLSVFIFGYLLNVFSLNIFPIILVMCLFMIALSILMIPKDINVKTYNTLKAYKFFFKKKNNNLIIFIIICSLLQGSHAMYYGYSTIIWENNGISFFKIGLLWSFAIIAEVFLFFKIDKYFKSSLLVKSLMLCSSVAFLRWTLIYALENFYLLLIIQSLHAITFALTHYVMIYFINKNLNDTYKLIAQSLYYTLSGGIFLTILTILSGHLVSYTNGDEGYLIMALLALFSSFILYFKRKTLR